jgi:hypothetical protein
MSIAPDTFKRSMGKIKPRKKKVLKKHEKISLEEIYGTKAKKT